jgi:hypothetical protein
MLLIYGKRETWDSWSEADYKEIIRGHTELQRELAAAGEYLGSEGLTIEGARTVRVRPGVPAVTDGPFTEAKELLAGYYLVDCESADRAAEIAARLPEACYDTIEVRRVMDRSEFGMPE